MLQNNDAMWAEMRSKEEALSALVTPARKAMESRVAAIVDGAKVWSGHFGATGIDPKHLYVYFAVPTREAASHLENSPEWGLLRAELITFMAESGFSVEALQSDWLGVVSQQACDEEAGGNWYHFFK